MCVDLIELFVRIILISPQLKIHVSCNDVLNQLVNTVLKFKKKKYIYIYIYIYISFIWPKLLTTDTIVDHKQCLKMLHCALFVIHGVYPLQAQLYCLRSQ
jgi:hypothetical protein